MVNINELRSLSLMRQQRAAIRARYDRDEIQTNEYSNLIAQLESDWYDAVNRAYSNALEFIQRDENNVPYVVINGVMIYDEPEFLVQILIRNNMIPDEFAQFEMN